MKCERISARTLRVSELPERADGLTMLPELEITINYVEAPNEGGRLNKAITLDSVVIPAIIAALNGAAPKE